MTKENKEAVNSSLMVMLAYGLLGGGLMYLVGKPLLVVFSVGVIVGIVGLVTGLLTTWDVEE